MSSHYRSSRKQYRAGIHVSTSTHMSLVTYACGLWCSCILSLLTSYDMLILRGISRVQLFPCSCVLINSQSCSSGGDFICFSTLVMTFCNINFIGRPRSAGSYFGVSVPRGFYLGGYGQHRPLPLGYYQGFPVPQYR